MSEVPPRSRSYLPRGLCNPENFAPNRGDFISISRSGRVMPWASGSAADRAKTGDQCALGVSGIASSRTNSEGTRWGAILPIRDDRILQRQPCHRPSKRSAAGPARRQRIENSGMFGKPQLDLGGLYPKAADLDLGISAAEEFKIAIG